MALVEDFKVTVNLNKKISEDSSKLTTSKNHVSTKLHRTGFSPT